MIEAVSALQPLLVSESDICEKLHLDLLIQLL